MSHQNPGTTGSSTPFDQHDGHFWGPDQCGQVDTGESTAGTLMAVEYYLKRARS